MAVSTSEDIEQRVNGHVAADAKARVRAAAARLADGRADAIAELNGIFAQGTVPRPAVDGRYRGELLGTTMAPALGAFLRRLTGLWLPWLGKIFSASQQRGLNYFMDNSRWLGHTLWPLYHRYRPDAGRSFRAFDFRTSNGPGVMDPGTQVLKLDYDLAVNPRFLIRAVLDELVEVEPGYYLGKVHLRLRGKYYTAGFFALGGPIS